MERIKVTQITIDGVKMSAGLTNREASTLRGKITSYLDECRSRRKAELARYEKRAADARTELERAEKAANFTAEDTDDAN